jgi:hypothetical protein
LKLAGRFSPAPKSMQRRIGRTQPLVQTAISHPITVAGSDAAEHRNKSQRQRLPLRPFPSAPDGRLPKNIGDVAVSTGEA